MECMNLIPQYRLRGTLLQWGLLLYKVQNRIFVHRGSLKEPLSQLARVRMTASMSLPKSTEYILLTYVSHLGSIG